jgi:CSLREA domain-containing protein
VGQKRHLLPAALIVELIALGLAASPAGAATVTKTADTNDHVCNADCSLREAIEAAAPGGTVTVPASATPYEVSDAFDTLVIDKSITVAGAGARLTEVTAPGTLATSPRPFTVHSPSGGTAAVTIRDMSITSGNGNGDGFTGGGGVMAYLGFGAIGSTQLTLERVRIANNVASINLANSVAVGGGVLALGPAAKVIVRNSVISGNQALGTGNADAVGGGLATFGAATIGIENSTIVDNRARSDSNTALSAFGGGAELAAGSSLLNVTLSGNSALKTAAGAVDGIGGNLFADSGVTVRNTIVTAGAADNAATADCGSPPPNSLGGNVLPPACGPGPLDRTATDAMLGPLADNGGQTDTMALLAGSPSLDAGVACPPPAADQRGVIRPQGPACDSGAFEVEVPTAPASATATKCQGKTATIVGTNRADTLKGTKKADVIASLGGNDKISALAGNDRVCARAGNDRVSGGKGKDRLNGEKGRDRLLGGGGKDILKGGTGRDTLIGGPGTDHLAGGAGKDTQVQ